MEHNCVLASPPHISPQQHKASKRFTANCGVPTPPHLQVRDGRSLWRADAAVHIHTSCTHAIRALYARNGRGAGGYNFWEHRCKQTAFIWHQHKNTQPTACMKQYGNEELTEHTGITHLFIPQEVQQETDAYTRAQLNTQTPLPPPPSPCQLWAGGICITQRTST